MSVLTACAVGAGTLATVASAGPPPGRAYELVSPVDDPSGAMIGLSTNLLPLPGIASDDGDRVLYGAGSVVGSSWSGPANPMIFGRRTATGWEARNAMRTVDQGDTELALAGGEAIAGSLSPDGKSYVFGMGGNFGAVPLPAGTSALVAGVFRSPDADVAPDWLTRPRDGIVPSLSSSERVMALSVTANRETDTVAFQSSARLLADAPPAGTSAVYASRNGQLELASRLPDGTVSTGVSNLANSPGQPRNGNHAVWQRGELAGNGRFVLFESGGAGNLYVRDLDRQVTHQLAGGGSGTAAPASDLLGRWGIASGGQIWVNVEADAIPVMVFGARDGARAYFKPHPEAGATTAPLYEANLETGSVTVRTAITGPPLGLSPDGRRMLFLAPPTGPLDNNNTPAGNWTLRYWDAATPNTSSVVGTIATAIDTPPFGLARVYRSSGDGRTWTFTAIGSPDPTRANVSPLSHQLYRWTVGDGTPTCLSCEPTDGVARTSGVNLTVQEAVATETFTAPTTAGGTNNEFVDSTTRKLAQRGHSVSDDGRWLLFDSPDRLVAEDTNDVRDVYLWDRDGAAGGQLQLVTSGTGNSPSYALDLDPTGRNAFFTTRDGLVPADDDSSYDVYSARIGGGFPGSPESCVGEACRPPVVLDPPHDLISSSVLSDPPAGVLRSVQQGSPKLRVRSVRTSSSRLTVRVDAPKAGRIRISGSRVRTTSRSAKRAATYSLRVPLSTSARRSVARGKTVKVRLRVSFTPSGSKKAQRVSSSVSVKKGR